MHPNPLQTLRSSGLQATAQRLAVLKAVEDCPHGTADEITRHARGELGTISRQAVYDALALFCERGLVRRVQPAGSPVRFDPRAAELHHHAVCRACGSMQDLDGELDLDVLHGRATGLGFRVDESELVLWGTCARCRERGSPPTHSEPA